MQKTFRRDCISKETVVNTGQLPKYWTQNHHDAIVSREIFDAAQEETAHRKAMASGTKKSAPTGLGKYSSKHALTGFLICGECGTPYRRVVWTQKGMKRPVWRCVNRLDHGKTLCKHSPTLDEKPLQEAVLAAVNILMSRKDELMAKRLQRAAAVMEAAPAKVTEWSESIVHQLVEEVKVLSKDEIRITFRNGITISQTISPIRQEVAS